jgi:hypothetical protein
LHFETNQPAPVMSNLNLHTITNSFQDVHLVSLASWREANEIVPHDRGGPYVVTQEGFDPDDMTMTADEFVIGRSGKWLQLGFFFHMPVPERRAEFVFGTAAEVMKMMNDLPSKPAMLRPGEKASGAAPQTDEMATAFLKAKNKTGGGT